MSAQSLVSAGLALLVAIGAVWPAAAQKPSRVRAVRPFIEIHPRPLLYRRCADWYVLQHRPSGTVLFPQYHCWWVRG